MLRNVTKNILLRSKNIILKRHNVPQVILNVRHKQNMHQEMTTNIDDDVEDSRPITFSKSVAANMKVDEYRLPFKEEEVPDYQSIVIILSLSVFLIYFCILREENDIDELIYMPLDSSLKRCETEYNEKHVKLVSK